MSALTIAQRRGLWVPPLVLAVFAAIGMVITATDLNSSEIALSIWFTLHQREPWSTIFEGIAVGLSPLGAAIITGVLALVVGWWRSLVAGLRLLALTGAGWGFAALIKPLVSRPRPDAALLFDPISPQVGQLSFPSGHTAFAAALASAVVLVVGRRASRHVGCIVGSVAVALVAVSRVNVGAHFLTDVTAGAILGATGVWFAVSLERWWHLRQARFSEDVPALADPSTPAPIAAPPATSPRPTPPSSETDRPTY